MDLRCQHIARLDAAPVFDDRAGAALGGVTAHMSACEVKTLAKQLYEQCMGGDIYCGGNAVYIELNLHGISLRNAV
jgi:hypothetical protein